MGDCDVLPPLVLFLGPLPRVCPALLELESVRSLGFDRVPSELSPDPVCARGGEERSTETHSEREEGDAARKKEKAEDGSARLVSFCVYCFSEVGAT
jgi:hypothetical protein